MKLIKYNQTPFHKQYIDSHPVKNISSENQFGVSFSGINPSLSTKIQYKRLCSKDEFAKILNLLDPAYKEHFENILSNLQNELKSNPNLFKNLQEDIKKDIADGHVMARPKKRFFGTMVDAVFAPITAPIKFIKNRFGKKETLAENKKLEAINTNLANIEGLVEYVNGLKEKNPQEIKKLIQDKIKKNFTKIKANYSSNLSTTLTDLATFLVAAVFHGLDFYNITRRVDDNHQAAVKEAKVKVKQDSIRLVVITYLTYLVTTLFRKNCNKSMSRMLAVASGIQIAAEILNRKLTGRPILPVDDKTLSQFNKKEKEKADRKQDKNQNKKVAFTGAMFMKKVLIPKNELKNILDLTEKIDAHLAKRYSELIEGRFSDNLKNKKLNEIYVNNAINEVSLGEKENTFGRVVKCIFIPITGAIKGIKKILNKEQAKADDMLEVRNYVTFIKRLLKTKYKGKNVSENKEHFKEFKNDVMNASLGSFRSTEANYNTANYSIIKRIFSYSIFTTFMSFDVFNVTMMHSDGDKKKSKLLAQQRAIQELTRFFISIYNASASLTLFGGFYNRALANAFGFTAVTSTVNQVATRKILGMPILPKTQKELQELDEKNQKSSFYKTVNKLTKKDKNVSN